MNHHLKEDVIHGTQDYPFVIYSVYDSLRPFHVSLHWHDEVEVIYVECGHLNLSINGTYYQAKAGDIFWINPRQIHQMGTMDLSTRYYAFLFHPKAISFQAEDMVEHEIFAPLCDGRLLLENQISSTIYQEVLSAIRKILHYNKKKPAHYRLSTKIALLTIVHALLSTGHTELLPADTALDQQKAILQFLNTHYSDKLSLEMLAKQFHMSEKYFSRYFKNNFHVNFTEYLNSLRMEKASDLLLETNLNITEIALQTGYPNISYFNRTFHAAFGCSPKQYRNGQ